MFPLYDENPTELVPVITLVIIGICGAAWIFVQGAGFDPAVLMASVCTFGVIPQEVMGVLTGSGDGAAFTGEAICQPGGLAIGATFTSMFMHGSWGHLLGNMWFLWVFGNNVEDSMGYPRFVLFYLLCGVGAAAAQIVANPGSPVPMVGASGAISGIMGAYAVLYPRVQVNTAIFLIIIFRIVRLPAWVMLGYWFLLQIVPAATGVDAGTAFWAHVGGFVAGVVLIKPFSKPVLVEAKVHHEKLTPAQIRATGWW
jgi:membrane associated rhomboid family serine protease